MSLKVNREIRAPKVRVIDHLGEQVGIIPLYEALAMAEEHGLDLVEIVPGSSPPVCKVMNFGKFRYDQSKREKENKKAQHQIKVKEIKLKPNIDVHDLETKTRHARDFLASGNKVKVTCTFRGREMMHPEIGEKIVREMCQELEDISTPESPAKMMGRMLLVVLAPGGKKKKEGVKSSGGTEESTTN
ncbi:Translation initiation factor IF-3 [Candidatus Protochlamydia amoebophila]|uniref:Translation initiation factor IF-3 n=1 Tax=Candidatus Protochlamydia amoebophila TaxID=362787 RepID=A0A0C1H573_9BACT|nr:Translation initiation factor IF-3 [Candidatus Protochlamydia amoebophila]